MGLSEEIQILVYIAECIYLRVNRFRWREHLTFFTGIILYCVSRCITQYLGSPSGRCKQCVATPPLGHLADYGFDHCRLASSRITLEDEDSGILRCDEANNSVERDLLGIRQRYISDFRVHGLIVFRLVPTISPFDYGFLYLLAILLGFCYLILRYEFLVVVSHRIPDVC